MKVQYDISVLGGGLSNQRARTGIFRVVEQLALQLAVRPEVELSFTALKHLRECLTYLERHDQFADISLPHVTPLLYFEDIKNLVSNRSKLHSFPIKHSLKALRELLNGTHKILKKVYGDPEKHSLRKCDIIHSPFLPLPRKQKADFRFITVYDLIPILFPQYFEFQEDHLLNRVMISIDSETWVFCISEATKNDLLNHNPRVDPEKVAVIPLGASKLFYPCNDSLAIRNIRQKYGIPDQPYFLSLSTLEPRKNIDSTIRSFASLVRQEKLHDISLVLVGAKGWDFDKIFDEISGCNDLINRIIVTGYVDDHDLAAIYSGALAFVYPSYYEGFGLPPLEAMQCGIPVITSNTSSLPEVVGNAGIQVDPRDTDALSQAMLNMYLNSDLRQELALLSSERAKLFSWEACADETIRHYRRAMNLIS